MIKSLASIVVFALLSQVVVAESLDVYSSHKDMFIKPVGEAFKNETGSNVIIHSGS